MLRKSIVCGILLLLIGAGSVQCTNINVETSSYSIVTNSLNQGLLIYYPTDDVQISQVFPDYNYNHVDNIRVRTENGSTPGRGVKGLVRFDISEVEIPHGFNITATHLYLYYYRFFDNNPAGRNLTMYRITSEWDESTVTWNTQPLNVSLPTATSPVPSLIGTWMEWNVTSDVLEFIAGTYLNYGWKITDENYWGDIDIPTSYFNTKENETFIPYLEIQIEERNEAPHTPSTPDGPSSRIIGESGVYSTSAVDPDIDDVLYLWDWDGDGVLDEWTGYYASGQTVSISHSWSSAGIYEVKVKAEDEHGAQSAFSSVLTVVVSEEASDPPSKPVISGPAEGKAGYSYTYSAMATDPDDDRLEYVFDWDDGTDSGWKGLYDSGVTCYVSHIWDAQGTYSIRVKARDNHGVESPWSDPLAVNMPKTKTAINPLILKIFECFPLLTRFLNHEI